MADAEPGTESGAADATAADAAIDDGPIPSVFDLVGYSLAAAHQSSLAAVAQLNVALAAYRLLQAQRSSVDGGADLGDAADGAEAVRRLLRRDTGVGPGMPPTFNQRRPETSSDSAGTRPRGE